MKNKNIFIFLVLCLCACASSSMLLGMSEVLKSAGKSFLGESVECAKIVGKSLLRESVESSKIVAGSIGAACIYGIANDQVSARVCPEYFTEGFNKQNVSYFPNDGILGWVKKQLQTTKSPTKIGLIWGVIATWWMGAYLSVPVMIASRRGSWPQLTMENLIKPTGVALGFMGASSAIAGLVGYIKAKKGTVGKNPWDWGADGVPEQAMNRFIADSYAHQVAYASGALAGLGLAAWAVLKRCSLQAMAHAHSS